MTLARRTENPDMLSKDRLRLWLKLLKASGMIKSSIRRRLQKDYSSTLPRFDVMAALFRYPDGLRMSQISEQLKVSNGNVTGIVDRLVENGLVRRTAVTGDRRAALVQLTQKGTEAFQNQARSHEAWVNEMLASLAENDIAVVGDQLDRITVSLESGTN